MYYVIRVITASTGVLQALWYGCARSLAAFDGPLYPCIYKGNATYAVVSATRVGTPTWCDRRFGGLVVPSWHNIVRVRVPDLTVKTWSQVATVIPYSNGRTCFRSESSVPYGEHWAHECRFCVQIKNEVVRFAPKEKRCLLLKTTSIRLFKTIDYCFRRLIKSKFICI